MLPDKLKDVVEEHQKWIDSDGREGQRAELQGEDLQGAQLQGAVLSNADLRSAILSNANLKEAILPETNLQKADLTGADLRGANLGRAELQEAILINANLELANLGGASLQNANLQDANLTDALLVDANLQGTIFLNANLQGSQLQDADLTEARRFVGRQLAGLDVSGTKLPEYIAKFEGLSNIEEAAKNARHIFLALLLGCFYSWLTILATTDAQLLTDVSSSKLPIIQTDVPIARFYWAAPFLLWSAYVYLHA